MLASVNELPSATIPPGLGRGDDIDTADEVPIPGDLADRHDDRGGKVSRWRDVIDLTGVAAGDPETRRQVLGQIDADGDVGQRRQPEGYRVADQQCAGRDRRGFGPAEGELPIRAGHDTGTSVAQPDMGGADGQLAVAVSIGEPHPHGVAADAGAGVHPQCLVAERRALGGRGSRRPGADPMLIIRHIRVSLRWPSGISNNDEYVTTRSSRHRPNALLELVRHSSGRWTNRK